jgi:Protein of unknown function (DUF2924)
VTNVQRLAKATLSERLIQLSELSREELIALWIKHNSKPPPKATSNALLIRAAAYTIQERSLGGLKSKDKKALARLSGTERATAHAPDVLVNESEDELAPVIGRIRTDAHKIGAREVCADKKVPKPKTRPAPRCGTRLVRNWQGKGHIVDVGEDGYTWNGKVYGSLTKIAFAITGARWSGPRFFRI